MREWGKRLFFGGILLFVGLYFAGVLLVNVENWQEQAAEAKVPVLMSCKQGRAFIAVTGSNGNGSAVWVHVPDFDKRACAKDGDL